MDVRDLSFFEVIATTGHLGLASDRLHRTKPALTKCVRRLEAEIGGPLFSRKGRGTMLTPVGEALLVHARGMRTAMADALRDVTDVATGQGGHMRLGMGDTIADYLLPTLADWFLNEMPRWTLSLQTGLGNQLRSDLADGRLDAIITTARPDDAQSFVTQDWITDDVVVVARPGHELTRTALTVASLARFRWVLPSSAVASRNWLDWTLACHNQPPPKVQVEFRSIHSIPAFVIRSELLSFMPRYNLKPGGIGAGLQEVRLAETTMRRTLRLLHRANGHLSPGLTRLAGLLHKTAGAWPPAEAQAAPSS